MRSPIKTCLALAAAVGLAAATIGCSQQSEEPGKNPARSAHGSTAKTSPQPKHKPEKPPEPPPPPPPIPKVALRDAQAAACLVKVGDKMPAGELVDFEGRAKPLDGLYGRKLTVVCFWSIGGTPRSKLVAAAVLRDLAKEVAGPFGAQGVGVVAVNVGDPIADARKYVADYATDFVNLHDPDGAYFGRLSSERKTPRTFLLDAGGKILWFDVEYSRPSRQDLLQGIEVALQEAGK